ncbi:MAG: transcriptional repressor [Candidatus Thorarchaeota archaeon]
MPTIPETHEKHDSSFARICRAMWKRYPGVSRSAILKNLATFRELGLIRAFSFRGETRYETNLGLHVNMVDRRGKIVDVEDEDVHGILEELIEKVREKTGRDAKSLFVMVE